MFSKNDYELLYLIAKNNTEAEEVMLKKYNLLVWKHVNRIWNGYVPLGVEREDLYQEGRIALYKSFSAFDPNRNVPFFSFANTCVENALSGYVRKYNSNASKQFYNSLSFDAHVSEDVTIYNSEVIEDPQNESAFKKYNEQFGHLYLYDKSLDSFEKNILVLQVAGFSYSETAKRLKCSVKKVDNTLQKIKKLLN